MIPPQRELPPMRVTTTVRQTASVVARRASALSHGGSPAPVATPRVAESRAQAPESQQMRPSVRAASSTMTLAELASLLAKQKRGQILDTTDLDEDDTVSNVPVVMPTSRAAFAARMLNRR